MSHAAFRAFCLALSPSTLEVLAEDPLDPANNPEDACLLNHAPSVDTDDYENKWESMESTMDDTVEGEELRDNRRVRRAKARMAHFHLLLSLSYRFNWPLPARDRYFTLLKAASRHVSFLLDHSASRYATRLRLPEFAGVPASFASRFH